MEADRPGGGAGGLNSNNSGNGSGRNPNGPKTVGSGAMAASARAPEFQDGEPGLSLPGILHFIQFEWSRFQSEKYRWESERDELRDALDFKIRHLHCMGVLINTINKRVSVRACVFYYAGFSNVPAESDSEQGNQMSWKEGRQLLRKYLEEVGYSDTILDMRSKRVRSLLGRSSPEVNGLTSQPGQSEVEPRAGENQRNKLQGMLSDYRNVDGLSAKASIPSTGPGQSRANEGGTLGFSSDVFILDSVGGGDMNLGELADLTVANDNDLIIDLQDSREEFKKTWNARFTLRSHFDGIRGLAFHPSQAVLLSAAEDGTLKLWNLDKAVSSKKNVALDVEPIYTFRAHSGAVLSLAMGDNGDCCYSGGLDGSVRCWKIPELNVDPYDNYDPSIENSVLAGHTDAVWGLAFSPALHRLVSCSADGTIRIWDTSETPACLSVFNKDKEHGIPTSVAFVNSDPTQGVVSYRGGETLLYDLNTEQSILELESKSKEGSALVNCVLSHPSLPISITAHENRSIRFLDNKTGKVIHSMVAHLDAVTCLAADPKGTYLISGSHDCSVRLWTLDSRTCVQEITAHRKKHDEAIHDVAFHPSQPYIASGGADALAKIFV
ncbi:UNVERIFIED_CONTAM: hypothetical protein FKN15_078486 [Acipenser sinensis]